MQREHLRSKVQELWYMLHLGCGCMQVPEKRMDGLLRALRKWRRVLPFTAVRLACTHAGTRTQVYRRVYRRCVPALCFQLTGYAKL